MGGWLEDILGNDGSAVSPIEVATHEAAHAVIAQHVGLSPIWVEIDPVNSRGEMTLETPWHPPTARQRLLVAQAGSAAQCRLNQITLGWTFEGTVDRVLSDDLAEEDPTLDPNNFTDIGVLLRDSAIWEKVDRLANLLLVRNRIEIPELREVLIHSQQAPK